MSKYQIVAKHSGNAIYSNREMFVADISTGAKKSKGVYRGISAPGSVQGVRMRWLEDKRRYPLPESALNRSGKVDLNALNKLVASMHLTDEAGEDIKTANPFNEKDSFYNNMKLELQLSAGYGIFDYSNPINKFIVDALKAEDNSFKVVHDGVARDARFPKNVKYTISPVMSAQDDVEEGTQETMAANEIILDLDAKGLKRYLLAIGVRQSPKELDEMDEKALRALLFNKVIINGTQKGRGNVKIIDLFMEASAKDDKEIDTENAINVAMSKQIIRKNKNRYYYGTSLIATSKKGVHAYLNQPSNKELLDQVVADVLRQ